jgi:predicted peroxiredoxin
MTQRVLTVTVEGPDKSIDRAVKMLVDAVTPLEQGTADTMFTIIDGASPVVAEPEPERKRSRKKKG